MVLALHNLYLEEVEIYQTMNDSLPALEAKTNSADLSPIKAL